MRLFKLLLAVGLACALLFIPSFVEGQDAKPQQQSNSTPLLRRVVVAPHGFDDGTMNDTVVNEQEQYLEKHLKDRPRVETAYDHKKADEMKKVLEDFWKERGIAVEVRITLKPVPRAPRYAVLEFDEYKQ
jgi:hypothetical protein